MPDSLCVNYYLLKILSVFKKGGIPPAFVLLIRARHRNGVQRVGKPAEAGNRKGAHLVVALGALRVLGGQQGGEPRAPPAKDLDGKEGHAGAKSDVDRFNLVAGRLNLANFRTDRKAMVTRRARN